MSRGSANTGETKTSPGAGEKTQPSCVMAAMGAGQSRETARARVGAGINRAEE